MENKELKMLEERIKKLERIIKVNIDGIYTHYWTDWLGQNWYCRVIRHTEYKGEPKVKIYTSGYGEMVVDVDTVRVIPEMEEFIK